MVIGKNDPAENWYNNLLTDLKKIEFGSIVMGKWLIGKRILEDFEKFGKPQYGGKRVENMAKDLGGSSADLWACIRFYRKYLDGVQELQDKSWREIWHKYLPETKRIYNGVIKSLPSGKYNIIYADPPWAYYAGGYKNQSQHYDSMSIEEICNLPVKELAADDCILFLWVTFPILPDVFKVIEAWGFTYSTVGFVWVKATKDKKGFFFGLGHWTRSNAELCLIATKGKIERKDASISQIIYESVEKHSKKPDIIRNKIIQLVGDLPRIELFARQKINGWSSWGNEL